MLILNISLSNKNESECDSSLAENQIELVFMHGICGFHRLHAKLEALTMMFKLIQACTQPQFFGGRDFWGSHKNFGGQLLTLLCISLNDCYEKQEAQLPQRNSASAAHMEGGWG